MNAHLSPFTSRENDLSGIKLNEKNTTKWEVTNYLYKGSLIEKSTMRPIQQSVDKVTKLRSMNDVIFQFESLGAHGFIKDNPVHKFLIASVKYTSYTAIGGITSPLHSMSGTFYPYIQRGKPDPQATSLLIYTFIKENRLSEEKMIIFLYIRNRDSNQWHIAEFGLQRIN